LSKLQTWLEVHPKTAAALKGSGLLGVGAVGLNYLFKGLKALAGNSDTSSSSE